MSGIRLLVGTRKGALVLTSDAKRKDWKVDGPHFAGWEIYHMKGSPVDPDRIYASQTSAWFGQIIQRSDDGGKTWETPGTSPEDLKGPDGMPKGESNMFVYDGIPGTHMWTTAPSIRGNSNASGISSPVSIRPTMFTLAWKTRRCSNQKTAEKRGASFLVFDNTIPARVGNRARAECVFTQS